MHNHVSLEGLGIGVRWLPEDRRTLLFGPGGMAHAQSLRSEPRDAARWTVSSDSSVVPTQTMYEPVNAVICSARGGREGWLGATYLVVTRIAGDELAGVDIVLGRKGEMYDDKQAPADDLSKITPRAQGRLQIRQHRRRQKRAALPPVRIRIPPLVHAALSHEPCRSPIVPRVADSLTPMARFCADSAMEWWKCRLPVLRQTWAGKSRVSFTSYIVAL